MQFLDNLSVKQKIMGADLAVACLFLCGGLGLSRVFPERVALIMATSVGMFIATVLAGIAVTRSFTQPLALLLRAIQAQSDKDVCTETACNRKDEFGHVLNTLSQVNRRWRESLGAILHSWQNTSAAAEELMANSEQSAAMAHQLQETIIELNRKAESTMEANSQAQEAFAQLVQAIDAGRILAERLGQSAQRVQSALENGIGAQQALDVSAGEISGAVKKAKPVQEHLNERLNVLSDAAAMLKKIADDTQLLAINARIEAAHAGDQGKGFAVIAGEVQKLAEQAKESATEISNEIAEFVQYLTTFLDLFVHVGEANNNVQSVRQETETVFGQIVETVKEQQQIALDLASGMESISAAKDIVAEGAKVSYEAVHAVTARVAEMQSIAAAQTESSQQVAVAAEHVARESEMVGRMLGEYKITTKEKGR